MSHNCFSFVLIYRKILYNLKFIEKERMLLKKLLINSINTDKALMRYIF